MDVEIDLCMVRGHGDHQWPMRSLKHAFTINLSIKYDIEIY